HLAAHPADHVTDAVAGALQRSRPRSCCVARFTDQPGIGIWVEEPIGRRAHEVPVGLAKLGRGLVQLLLALGHDDRNRLAEVLPDLLHRRLQVMGIEQLGATEGLDLLDDLSGVGNVGPHLVAVAVFGESRIEARRNALAKGRRQRGWRVHHLLRLRQFRLGKPCGHGRDSLGRLVTVPMNGTSMLPRAARSRMLTVHGAPLGSGIGCVVLPLVPGRWTSYLPSPTVFNWPSVLIILVVTGRPPMVSG